MSLPALFVACGLSLLALAYVLYPLYRGKLAKPALASSLPETNTQSFASSASDREQAARLSLQEVELDYQLGNIAEADYRSLRERYVQRAIVAMKLRNDNAPDGQPEPESEQEQMTHTRQDMDIDSLIEEQLRKMREQRGDDGGNDE